MFLRRDAFRGLEIPASSDLVSPRPDASTCWPVRYLAGTPVLVAEIDAGRIEYHGVFKGSVAVPIRSGYGHSGRKPRSQGCPANAVKRCAPGFNPLMSARFCQLMCERWSRNVVSETMMVTVCSACHGQVAGQVSGGCERGSRGGRRARRPSSEC